MIGCSTGARAAVIALSEEIHLLHTLRTRGRLVAVIVLLVVIAVARGIIARLPVLLVVLLMMMMMMGVVLLLLLLLLLLHGGHVCGMLCIVWWIMQRLCLWTLAHQLQLPLAAVCHHTAATRVRTLWSRTNRGLWRGDLERRVCLWH